jgi:Glyoxalase-like domain
MFARGYIEVLFKTADTPLARQLDAGLARYGGVHLAAFSVADAAAAHARLAASGFRMQPLVQMQRPVDTGAGPGTAAFTLARVEPGEMPEGRIQILTHRTEHTVWQPRWLSHPNGAFALTSVTIAVADVKEAAQRFARFTGRNAAPSSLGQTIALDRGRVELVTADAFARMLPDVPIPSLPFTGAYGIRVKSLAALGDMLRQAHLATRPREQDLVATFPEEIGHGAWLFSE